MAGDGERLTGVLAAIDAVNACDPNRVETQDGPAPAELVYGRRMSATLARVFADASEHLRIAVRGQHIERWTSPRSSYPDGRAGYLAWRNRLKSFHAARVGEIMAGCGYDQDDVSRVGSLIRKERLKSDPEAQRLEDVVCLVFLEYYLGGFAAKTAQDKLAGILAKTWSKMSPVGQAHARELALPPSVAALVSRSPP